MSSAATVTSAAFLFWFLLSSVSQAAAGPTSIDTDKEALLAFRSQVSSQPPAVFSSWDDGQASSSSPCNWTGVSCDESGSRVVALGLSGLGLVGTITPFIGNLSFLQSLELHNNQFTGNLPDQICSLVKLRVLNMSSNRLEGSIPGNVSRLAELKVLDLSMNSFTGWVPNQLGSLLHLEVLNLGSNLLSGPIPASISNITSLVELHLSTNSFSGSIPGELSLLRSLEVLDLTINELTGTVPSTIYNMSSLTYLALASNQLWGTIPGNVGETLPNLLVFRFCFNRFTGGVPGSLHNLTNMRVIRMAHNLLEGTVPPGLGNLPFLEMYNIRGNRIASSGTDGLGFITCLTNSTRLKLLAIDENLFEGEIPESVGNLSKDLTLLYMGDNRIHGSIPSSIARLHGLTLLNISYNAITGQIPDEIGQLENLQELILAGNRIQGRIPDSFGKLQRLNVMDLSRNELVGRIPSSFGNFHSLVSMDLSSNRLNGSIPKEVFSLPSLSIALNLSRNYLTGELNEDLGLLHNVVTIDLSSNFLSGNIPISIRNCKGLVRLFMARNSLSGSIPSTIREMKGLEVLDLAYNNLSGVIPPELLHLEALQFLDLSFNNLEADTCSKTLSKVRFEGNPKLLSLSTSCKKVGGSSSKKLMVVYVSVAVIATLALCFYLVTWVYLRKHTAKATGNLEGDEHQLVSFEELRRATENFSSENLLGSGGFGTVYRGKLSDNSVVAVKALNVKRTGSRDSFLAECKALSNVRHRNIVKLVTTCSSWDSENQEFWALVYEFLPNGSLADWLQAGKDGEKRDRLTLLQRLNIAIDIASALDYLHHGCQVPVVHCDLKPSNILLDQDMTAKVGDFGLARLLIEQMAGDHKAPISSCNFIKGSIGYIPPEYGVGSKPSIAGDTYSFGVMLLQLFTGKSPIDEGLMESEQSLMGWVRSAYPGEVMEVVDPDVVSSVKPEMEEQCLVKILGVGLWCSAGSPDGRISMRDALWNLQAARRDLVASYLRRLKQ
ncbi:unnamed protein product [Linum trigynum]|uniref:non-specific serine/threonine protein kinase n=1 Tax=Linum trigynum TaxID=586398 RepID=A0AAV2G0B2_9ROSI